MARFLIGACALIALFAVNADAQPKALPNKGWGSLTGTVTYDGNPPFDDFAKANAEFKKKLMLHADKACCLDPKALPADTSDQTWVVDPKTKGVANIMVYLKAPEGFAFPTHPMLKKRPSHVIDQPFCAFVPRISGYNPETFDEAKGDFVKTKQKLTIKNSAIVSHNVRAIGQTKYNKGFNENFPPKTDAVKEFNPQPLPMSIQCDAHPWMQAKLFVFDHPYYVVTDKDGKFELPFVPVGVEIGIAAWHEDIGYLLPLSGANRDGHKITLKDGKNTFDFSVKKTPAP